MVNYTLGDGFEKLREFEVRSGSGEVCIASSLDYEKRNVFEFPVVATDRGKKGGRGCELKLPPHINQALVSEESRPRKSEKKRARFGRTAAAARIISLAWGSFFFFFCF